MSTTTEPEFVYGWGRTKHIRDTTRVSDGRYSRGEVGLCGASGGYQPAQPQRPLCKRCASMAGVRDPKDVEIDRLSNSARTSLAHLRWVLMELGPEPPWTDPSPLLDAWKWLVQSEAAVGEPIPATPEPKEVI